MRHRHSETACTPKREGSTQSCRVQVSKMQGEVEPFLSTGPEQPNSLEKQEPKPKYLFWH